MLSTKSYFILLALLITIPTFAQEPITPIPLSIPYDAQKAQLGQRLFFDPILSRDRTIACVSCHDFGHGGADTNTVSLGVGGAKGKMQAPTVLNAVFNFTQFWNGRAPTLKDQAMGPIHNPLEMAMSSSEITSRLAHVPLYAQAFARIYGRNSITIADVADVVAEYEKTLITPNSPFDRYLRHEAPLAQDALRGYQFFKRAGCASCHNGVLVGGNSFQKIGVMSPYPRDPHTDDRYAITKNPRDKNVFKVPTLRNIAQTAPYFHDGSAKTLPEAIRTMSLYNIGVKPSKQEENDLIAFLNSLSAPLPKTAKAP
jgi:cytochrome c peroxidase